MCGTTAFLVFSRILNDILTQIHTHSQMNSFRTLSLIVCLAIAFPAHVSTVPDENDVLHRIKNVVVLVMENRSYDHLFGYLDLPGSDNLLNKPPFYNPVSVTDPHSPKIATSMGAPFVAPLNPDHEANNVRQQIYGVKQNTKLEKPYPPATMLGFVQENLYNADDHDNIAGSVMQGFNPEDIAVTTTLAREFAVIDRYFCSVPGPTHPNRAFVHSATSNGDPSVDKMHMVMGFPQKTIYDSLLEKDVDWRVYFNDAPAVGLFRSMRKPTHLARMRPWKHFWRDAMEGHLKPYSFIEPRYFDHAGLEFANDDHPPHDVRRGQMLIKQVYETLRLSPQWNSTLLLITYDEHGGYFDHVPPPDKNVPNPDGKVSDQLDFDSLGVRVPMIAISPWIKKGLVYHRPQHGPFPTSEFEHSSIPATIKKLFNLPHFLTKRDAWAGTLDELWTGDNALNEIRDDCPRFLPRPVPIAHARRRRRSLPVNGTDETGSTSTSLTDMQRALVMVVRALSKDTSDVALDSAGGQGEDGVRGMDEHQAASYVRHGMQSVWQQLGADPKELD